MFYSMFNWASVPQNFQQLMSIGSQRSFQLWFLHCSTKSWYLASFTSWAFSRCSPQFLQHDQLLSCIREDKHVWTGSYLYYVIRELHLFSKIHSLTGAEKDKHSLICVVDWVFFLVLRKWILFFLVWYLLVFMTVTISPATLHRTWLWREYISHVRHQDEG